MERVLDFSDVTNCDLSLMGSDMVLRLSQGDVVTKIRIGTTKVASMVSNALTTNNASTQLETAPARSSVSKLIDRKPVSNPAQRINPITAVKRKKRVPLTRLNETQVKEIRANWDAAVKACGSKNAAADHLAGIYNCSAKNIYAIIYRYSWANI